LTRLCLTASFAWFFSGIGASLINKPQFVHDLVRQTRNRCREDLSVSVKIRIHDDVADTVALCQHVAGAGVDFITVHGRTPKQRGEPVNERAISDIVAAVRVPVLANGDVRSLEDARAVTTSTGAAGVMAARGVLENPAMFAGFQETPKECVQDWIRSAFCPLLGETTKSSFWVFQNSPGDRHALHLLPPPFDLHADQGHQQE